MNRCQRVLLCGSAFVVLLLGGWWAVAQAGPNAGGTIIVHDVGLDGSCEAVAGGPLSSCVAADNTVDSPFTCPAWKVYAAFPGHSHPRLKSLRWGMSWSSASLYVVPFVSPDPSAVDVVMTAGWPYSGTGVTMTFHTVQTTELVELYVMLGSGAYGGSIPSGITWSLIPHPSEPSVFLDDSPEPLQDLIADYGTLGFGLSGYTPCPDSLPVPTVETTWGHIKGEYLR